MAVFRWVVAGLFAVIVFHTRAQLNFQYREGTFMLKGRVVDIKTKQPVSLASVRICNGSVQKNYACDPEGQFVVYVSASDTLKVSAVGYIARSVAVRSIDSTRYYTLQIELIQDFVKLKEVVVYPYRSVDEFKEAFIQAKNQNKVTIHGIEPPKYSNEVPKAKFSNPVTFIYERLRRKRAANPDFKP
ncbi:MAG: carboxypeptidase-like regulatory domain-containing protein [Chitinophagales bacterium]|nr:carboxypeptidase-like regulatory domain-containing protein [Chitinophagales bacterium]MDW8419702.1 carboxypeptidase-like regulatory domain-containing protein [Chitinophagales bacterium]